MLTAFIFDKVDIGVLCHKLRAIGISGKLGILIHNFLSNRKQVVLANGVKSKASGVRSGVPQGTVLGPVLFLLLINDIVSRIESFVSLFSDDTRIARKVNTEEDVEYLQSDLESYTAGNKQITCPLIPTNLKYSGMERKLCLNKPQTISLQTVMQS